MESQSTLVSMPSIFQIPRVFEVGPEGNEPYVDHAAVAPGWTNDMFVGRDGRAYVGNFDYDLFSKETRPTQLIMVDADRTVTVEPGELGFPNGMVRRSDGKLVVAETFAPGWRSSTSPPTVT